MIRREAERRRGVVLVLVLGLLLLVVALALALGGEVAVECTVAAERVDAVRLRALADSAVERALAALRHDDTPASDSLFDAWRDEPSWGGLPGDGGRTWLLLREPDPGDGVELRFGVRDEASKLDVNVASAEQLGALPGITEEAVEAILDWRDGDDEAREQGAESAYYAALDPPYQAKNAPFESLDELLRVKGIDEAMLYGEDRNRNGRLDPGEDDGDRSFPPDDADGELDRGLVDYLTVFSRELNRTAEGKARLRWSQASPAEVEARLLAGGASEAVAARVRLLRASAPSIGSRAELLARLGVSDRAQVAVLLEELTFVDADFVPGRINVNTAARPVLAGLPGLEEEQVDAILARRADPTAELSSPAWLLEVVPFATFIGIADSLTTRSHQFTIDAVALLDDRPRSLRVEALVDRSYVPPRILLRREISALGFPLPGERGEELP